MLNEEQSISSESAEIFEQSVEKNIDKVDLNMIRHSAPSYVKKLIGKSLTEIIEIFSKKEVNQSAISISEWYGLAVETGEELIEKKLIPDLIIYGPSQRTKITAEVIALRIQGNMPNAKSIPTVEVENFAELEPALSDLEESIKENKQFLKDPNKISSSEELRLIFRKALEIYFHKNVLEAEKIIISATNQLIELAKKNNASKILVVSHGLMLSALKAKLEKKDIIDIIKEPPISYCQGFSADLDIESGLLTLKK